MTSLIFQLVQFLILVLVAPLVTGMIKKMKSLLQGRKGPRLLQPYYDLYKYMNKDSVVSIESSWLFTITPYVVFGATLTATALIPAIYQHSLFSFTGDFVLLIYLFSLSRFFIALAGIDTGSSFGAQAVSRDLFLSALTEPVLFVTILVTALHAQSTNLSVIAIFLREKDLSITPAYFMMLVAFIILLVVETGRVPVDNPDTHLELTMIHEGPLLEYSGKSLSLLMWSAWIKQLLLFTLFLDLCFPWGMALATTGGWGMLTSLLLFLLKLVCVSLLMAIIEMSNAKMRLFRVPRLLSAALILSLFALVSEYLF